MNSIRVVAVFLLVCGFLAFVVPIPHREDQQSKGRRRQNRHREPSLGQARLLIALHVRIPMVCRPR